MTPGALEPLESGVSSPGLAALTTWHLPRSPSPRLSQPPWSPSASWGASRAAPPRPDLGSGNGNGGIGGGSSRGRCTIRCFWAGWSHDDWWIIIDWQQECSWNLLSPKRLSIPQLLIYFTCSANQSFRNRWQRNFVKGGDVSIIYDASGIHNSKTKPWATTDLITFMFFPCDSKSWRVCLGGNP